MTGRRDTRLGRLSSGLTAQERAVLVMRSWRDDTEEDVSWRLSMQPEQVREFNRLIGLMNGVARCVLPYATVLVERVDKIGLRLGWLATFVLWQHQASRTADYIEFSTKEPVTGSEHEERKQQAGGRFLPAHDLVEVLLERNDWADDDLAEDGGEVYVRLRAWRRERAAKLKELARLVKDGALPGRGSGAGLELQAGPFYARLGEPAPVLPEHGQEFEVVPDDQAAEARVRRQERLEALEGHGLAPKRPAAHIEDCGALPDGQVLQGAPGAIDDAIDGLKGRVREALDEEWRRLRVVETVLGEVSGEFGGEDLAPEPVRHVLDRCRTELEAHHAEAERYLGPLGRREPDEGELAWLRGLVEGDHR